MNKIEKDLIRIVEGVGIPIMDFEGSTILISGGCGFLGSWFVALFEWLNEHSFARPCRVTVIDSFIATDKFNHLKKITDKNISFVKADISEVLLREHYDYIIHAAGVASPIYYRKYPIETIKGMAVGLIKLLDHAVHNPVKSFLCFSSSEIYGNPDPSHVPTPETYNGNVSCIGPRSCYDEGKRIEEATCIAYHRIHALPVKWVRPFNVYGPGMRVKDDRVVPKFTFQALKGEDLTVHLPSLQTRTLCYITDAMIGFLKVLLIGKNGEVYNIGDSEPEITMRDLAMKIAGVKTDVDTKITYLDMPTEYPQDQAQRRCPDITKAKQELNFIPKVGLDEGLELTRAWCKEQL